MNMYSAVMSVHYSSDRKHSRDYHMFLPWLYKIGDHLSKQDTHGFKHSKTAVRFYHNDTSPLSFYPEMCFFPGKSRAPALW